MKIGVGQIIFRCAGARQRMNYCCRSQRATARVPASASPSAPSPRSGEGWGEAAALTKRRKDFASSIL